MDRILRELRENQNIRTNLSDLRKAIKAEDAKAYVLAEVSKAEALYLGFLQSEDAKTRKNAALLLGDLEYQNAATALYETYAKETTLFVRAAYLQALANLNVEDKLDALTRILTIMDIYDSLIADDRPYKKAKPIPVAFDILEEEASYGKIDKELLEIAKEIWLNVKEE